MINNENIVDEPQNEEKGADPRLKLYKNLAKHEDMRRRRTECSVELRKQKRDDQLMKRRNLVEDEDEGGGIEENQSESGTTSAPPARMSLEEVLACLQNQPTLEQTRDCFESIRRMLSKSKNPPVDAVINTGLVHALVQALSIEDVKIRYEAAWAITNIVSGTSEQTMKAVEAGAAAPLIALTLNADAGLAEQALWAVANIAGDCAQLRDHVIQCGGVSALMTLSEHVSSLTDTFVRTLAWAFSNMCRHKNPHAPLEVLKQLSVGLARLLATNDKMARQDTCWAISYLTDGPDDQIALAKQAGMLPVVAHMLQEDEGLVAPALRVLGNCATGNDELTQTVVDLGVLLILPSVAARAKSSSIVKECCWLISNVIAGTQAQIQAVIDAGLLEMLVNVLRSGDYKSQFECSWALSNLAQGGTAGQMLELYAAKPVEALCMALQHNQPDLLRNILEIIHGLLTAVSAQLPDELDALKQEIEEYGGLDRIEELQQDESEQVYACSYRIITEFFSEDDDEEGVPDENAVPNGGPMVYKF